MLHVASWYGHISIVKRLVEEFKADPCALRNVLDRSVCRTRSQLWSRVALLCVLLPHQDGASALHEAAYQGHLEVVQFLLSINKDLLNATNQVSAAIRITV